MLAGGPWGVIRAVTAGITRCLGCGAASSVGGGAWGRGQVMLGGSGALPGATGSFGEQGGLGLSRRDPERGAVRAIYLHSGGEGAAYFWKCFMTA